MLSIQENVMLAPLTTFQIGGAARYFVDVRTEGEVREALQWAKERSVRHVVWAGGSNVLIPDAGLDALVIRVMGDTQTFSNQILEAEAGCNLLMLIREAGERGLGGWEKLAGIPGTIGGAVRGNAGAFGPEIKDFVTTVRGLNVDTGEVKEFDNAACHFSYRHSFFKDHPEWIILGVQIRLAHAQSEELKKLIEETIQERERRHLQNVRAAGSYFMNPVAPKEIQKMFKDEKGSDSREGRVPAGWLIEKAGMKGVQYGGAIASVQHPNYIVNMGSATANDVLELAARIKAAVKEKFGIDLKEEAAIL